MLSFNWNSIDESTFQGHLNKYTNAFKGYQTRYFVIDTQAKMLLYFTPEDVRKKGPRGFIELTDCWVSPSNEDDVTFTVQTSSGDMCRLRAMNARGRQKWIDQIRACSGSNAANVYVSSLPVPKVNPTSVSPLAHSPSDVRSQPFSRRNSKVDHHQQTVKELKEVIRCVEVNQREFVETIEVIPETVSLHSLSKDMLLLRSISQSCISSLQDSLDILTRRRTPGNEPLPTSAPSPAITNTYHKQLSQPFNSDTSAKSNVTVGLPSQLNTVLSPSKTSTLGGASPQNATRPTSRILRSGGVSPNRLSESTQ